MLLLDIFPKDFASHHKDIFTSRFFPAPFPITRKNIHMGLYPTVRKSYENFRKTHGTGQYNIE